MPETPSTLQSDSTVSAELWDFAVRCYAIEKQALLGLQESADLHINDGLLMAFAVSRHRNTDLTCWRQVREGRPRQLLLRVRRYRQQMPRSHPARPMALEWELALERWDLDRLSACLSPGDADLLCSGRIMDVAVNSLVAQSALRGVEVKTLINRLVQSGHERKAR